MWYILFFDVICCFYGFCRDGCIVCSNLFYICVYCEFDYYIVEIVWRGDFVDVVGDCVGFVGDFDFDYDEKGGVCGMDVGLFFGVIDMEFCFVSVFFLVFWWFFMGRNLVSL